MQGTVGIIYRQQDMPFDENGITPDIIMNPHAIPSRMTIGQLLECVMGKACVELGQYGDATPFTNISPEDIAQLMQQIGLDSYGDSVLYNGHTGERMQCKIFMGPTYYQRLKHMASDKMHSRANSGPIVMLSRQPAEGRSVVKYIYFVSHGSFFNNNILI